MEKLEITSGILIKTYKVNFDPHLYHSPCAFDTVLTDAQWNEFYPPN